MLSLKFFIGLKLGKEEKEKKTPILGSLILIAIGSIILVSQVSESKPLGSSTELSNEQGMVGGSFSHATTPMSPQVRKGKLDGPNKREDGSCSLEAITNFYTVHLNEIKGNYFVKMSSNIKLDSLSSIRDIELVRAELYRLEKLIIFQLNECPTSMRDSLESIQDSIHSLIHSFNKKFIN